jgi:photosystem II stability/assembly factor-like uncharacterized protein
MTWHVKEEMPLMKRNTQVSDSLSARAAVSALAAFAVAVLLGGCALVSSSQPAGSAFAVDCARGGHTRGPAVGGAEAGGRWARTGAGAAPLRAIQFTDSRHGWVVGARRILATSDGGHTWTRQYTGPARLRQVDFTNPADGWAVGRRALLRTTDGGASWTSLSEPRLNGRCMPVSAVHFVSPVLGYAIAGNTGTLLRTTDGGVSWGLATGAPAVAQAACFSSAQDGYLGTLGRIWRTTDAGATWSLAFSEPTASVGQQASRMAGDPPELGCAAHGAAWALFLGSGAAMMHAPYLAYATQDGRSWHGVLEEPMLESAIRPKLHLPAGPGSEPGPFSVISAGAAAFVGYTPAIGWGAASLIVATNGGTVLNSAGDIPAINVPLAVAFLTPAQGWVVGENLKAHTFSIEATTDAGRSWTTQYTTS